MPKSILGVLMVIAAVVVISMRHQSRIYFSELQKLQHARDDLNTEWSRLLLEEGAWSQHQRIEMTARKKLKMIQPDPADIQLIRLDR